MATELNAGSGGPGMGCGEAWIFPHDFFLIFPRPHSGWGSPCSPTCPRRQAATHCPLVLQMPGSPVLLVLPAPPLSTE